MQEAAGDILKVCSECGAAPVIAKGYCWVHYQRNRRTGMVTLRPRPMKPAKPIPPTYLQRLFDKIDVTSSCWLWKRPNRSIGYGYVTVRGKHQPAHRVAYELFVGAIPEGLEIDHLCRVRRCVNPDHLEAVTHAENMRRSPTSFAGVNARRTHCKKGHPYDAANTRRDKEGRRVCLACYRHSYSTPGARATNRIAVLKYRQKAAIRKMQRVNFAGQLFGE